VKVEWRRTNADGFCYADAERLYRMTHRAFEKSIGNFPQRRRELEFWELPIERQLLFAQLAYDLAERPVRWTRDIIPF
jgi:hypothetical protein